MTPEQLQIIADAREFLAICKEHGVGILLRVGRIEAAVNLIAQLLSIIDGQQVKVNELIPGDGEDR